VSAALRLAAAVAVNTAAVAAEGRWRLLDRRFGRRAWVAHTALVLPAWAAFLRSLPQAPRTWPRPARAARVTGVAAECGGALLVALGFWRLGPAAAVNGDLFGLVPRRPLGPLWGVVPDPIYTGYALWLAGWALRTGRPRLLPVAAEMLALLTVEARVEDRAAAWRRERAPAAAD
jgi:protein-S-isoprenylcysteine O-methyltransferase Ste14